MADEKLICPVHGEVEGLSLSEGPLSECHPWVLVCEECYPHHTVIVGYELDDEENRVRRRWEDLGEAWV